MYNSVGLLISGEVERCAERIHRAWWELEADLSSETTTLCVSKTFRFSLPISEIGMKRKVSVYDSKVGTIGGGRLRLTLNSTIVCDICEKKNRLRAVLVELHSFSAEDSAPSSATTEIISTSLLTARTGRTD